MASALIRANTRFPPLSMTNCATALAAPLRATIQGQRGPPGDRIVAGHRHTECPEDVRPRHGWRTRQGSEQFDEVPFFDVEKVHGECGPTGDSRTPPGDSRTPPPARRRESEHANVAACRFCGHRSSGREDQAGLAKWPGIGVFIVHGGASKRVLSSPSRIRPETSNLPHPPKDDRNLMFRAARCGLRLSSGFKSG